MGKSVEERLRGKALFLLYDGIEGGVIEHGVQWREESKEKSKRWDACSGVWDLEDGGGVVPLAGLRPFKGLI